METTPRRSHLAAAERLPTWPLVAMFAFFPLWWVIGVVDVMWVPIALVMFLYMQRAGHIRAPRGFGIWLLFLLWAWFSAINVSGFGDVLGFVYRYLMYGSATIFFLYVYNARATLTARFVCGVMTTWWLITVVGGYLGMLLPGMIIRTPVSYLVPSRLLDNGLVAQMVIRRFAQYNADSYLQLAPRPSAPFLYTNNWGNVYSLLLPFVFVYLLEVRGTPRFRWLLLALAASAVPAALTLNRGMFLAIAVSCLYVAGRLALKRDPRGIMAIVGLGVIGLIAYQLLPIQERLETRLSGETNSNTARSSLYLQAFELVPGSPLFGYGGPQQSAAQVAPVGTQGQFWMLLVSHGPFATALFMGFFIYAFWRIRKRRDPVGIACATVMLVGTMEFFYYGVVPNGLPLLMIAAALGLRREGARH